ncbi:hypothetical protein BU25DRAFT_416837 [Macroventuria anomochaeta]|uniref:Uncharacterized protein n=1 Tax=Macroventuria anomochaeta TaxID=301207 RepID=A0ACB6SH86_9PLEO|nr:uncharacterized protein BU25DRAFT_416837 [Macroventuria anomochaeta]KAF2633660.1 hypothetical protein BU25DRAFT_416837 [Macroventuria anomochaeta]
MSVRIGLDIRPHSIVPLIIQPLFVPALEGTLEISHSCASRAFSKLCTGEDISGFQYTKLTPTVIDPTADQLSYITLPIELSPVVSSYHTVYSGPNTVSTTPSQSTAFVTTHSQTSKRTTASGSNEATKVPNSSSIPAVPTCAMWLLVTISLRFGTIHIASLAISIVLTTSTTSTIANTQAQTLTFLPPPTYVSNLQNAAISATDIPTPIISSTDLWTADLSTIRTSTPEPSSANSSNAASSSVLPSRTGAGGVVVEVSGAWVMCLGLLGLQAGLLYV